jgi:hypothetical protein
MTLHKSEHCYAVCPVMLSVIIAECHIQGLYTECHYAECRYAECRSTVTSIGNKY